MQTKSYAPSGHYSAESIAFSRYSLAMLALLPPQQLWQLGEVDGQPPRLQSAIRSINVESSAGAFELFTRFDTGHLCRRSFAAV